MSSTQQSRQIREKAQAAVADLDLAVEDVTVTPAGRRRVVRVLVDRNLAALGLPDASTPVDPLDLDEVADATKRISDALDGSDAMGSAPYVLEVSSPGVDRPLTDPHHFRRNVGRLVRAATAEGEVTGRVSTATEDGVDLQVAATATQAARTVHLPYADISRAQVQVEFTRGAQGEDA